MGSKHSVLISIGKKIRQHRSVQGYTQEGFAARAGLDRAYYGGVERGERNISALNLVNIALALEIEVGELFPKLDVLKSLLDMDETAL